MALTKAHQLVQSDFQAMNQCITDSLSSKVALVNQLSGYIVESGGKRLRPLLHLLMAHACGYQGQQHIPLAAVIEFIHTATLLHDDVVDHSFLRRGKQTAHIIWGSEASVLVGDFLYSRAFQMMVAIPEQSLTIMQIMADVTNTIAEGEVLQLVAIKDINLDETEYFNIIERKTAVLFAAATELSAVLANRNEEVRKACRAYGLSLGFAFQLVDDALDFTAESSEQIGKNIGDDLAEGKITLPLLYALNHCSKEKKLWLEKVIREKNIAEIDSILAVIETTGAIQYTYDQAKNYAALAKEQLKCLPESVYLKALYELADFSVERSF